MTIATEFRDRRQREERKHRLNREIMAPEVRLSGADNEPLGVVTITEALRLAGEADVDLVEISPTAVPPVCRLMDYGKFKYAEQKKAAEAKSKQKVIEIKEIMFRPGTDDGDYNIKVRNIKRFLDDGDKCKITLRFRGREITHQELGLALLARIRDELADLIVVEQFPKLEGRQMVMMIAPGRKKPASGGGSSGSGISSSGGGSGSGNSSGSVSAVKPAAATSAAAPVAAPIAAPEVTEKV